MTLHSVLIGTIVINLRVIMRYPHFPDGILLKKHVGRIIRVQGVQYQLERLMAEKYDRHLVQRVALFEAKKSDTQETAVVKFRFQ